MKRSALNAHEGGQTRNPTLENLAAASKVFHISIDVLVKVDLAKISELRLRELESGNDDYITGAKQRILTTTVDRDNNENVEVVPVKAKAGYMAGYSDPEYIAQLPVFYMPQLPRGRKYRMFPVSGDSMLPIPDGAFVIAQYQEDWKQIKSGTPCIVVLREEGIVFKILENRLADNRSLLLVSLNSAYEPFEVRAKDVLEIWTFHSFWSKEIPEPGGGDLSKLIWEIYRDVKVLRENIT